MKTIIGLISVFLFFTFQSKLYAQQQAGLTFYNQLSGLYNPSAIPDEYTKNLHNIIVGTSTRTQWTKLNSAPKTQTIHAEYVSDFDNTFNFLMGGYLINDKVGPIQTTGFYGKIASIMSKYNPEIGGFSAGIQLGMTQYRINTTSLQEKYPDDILTQLDINTIKPAIGIGISYYKTFKSNNFFKGSKLNTGISVSQIGFSKHEFEDDFNKFNIYTDPHLYFYGKLFKEFRLKNAIEINTWVKYVPDAPINADIHLLYYVDSNLWIEIGTNTSGIGHVGIGFSLHDFFKSADNLLKVTYGYNPSFIKYGTILGNSHDLSLKYSVGKR